MEISQGFMLIIGLIAAFISYLQYKISKYKVMFELYDRRKKVYHAIKTSIVAIGQNLDVTNSGLKAYIEGTEEGVFLFDKKFGKYIDEIYEKMVELQVKNQELRDPNREKSVPAEKAALSKWLIKQLGDDGLKDKIYPFMNFKEFKTKL